MALRSLTLHFDDCNDIVVSSRAEFILVIQGEGEDGGNVVCIPIRHLNEFIDITKLVCGSAPGGER